MTSTIATYAIRVEGHLDDHWAAWLTELSGELDITRSDDGTSTLTASTVDQAQLHGVLAGLRDIGAELLDLRVTGPHRAAIGEHAPNEPLLERPMLTERLTLRAATVDDADATWRYRSLDPVNEWLAGCPADLDGYRRRFTGAARLATTVIVCLGHGPAGHIIGDLMLRRDDAWAQLEQTDHARGRQAELGWVLDPAYSGHGYATEAVRALLRYCFRDLGIRRVTANCFLGNEMSWRLMERVGMRREGHAVRDSLHRSGAWCDTVTYALLADERRG
jgi:RimJ/RimL family protein N-acetyltransferase